MHKLKIYLASLLLAMFTTASFAQNIPPPPPPPPPGEKPGFLISPVEKNYYSESCSKKPISQKMDYPKMLIGSGVYGSVDFGIAINGCGDVRAAMIIRSSGNRVLDKAALEGVVNWTIDAGEEFHPGHGGPARITVKFQDQSLWSDSECVLYAADPLQFPYPSIKDARDQLEKNYVRSIDVEKNGQHWSTFKEQDGTFVADITEFLKSSSFGPSMILRRPSTQKSDSTIFVSYKCEATNEQCEMLKELVEENEYTKAFGKCPL